MDGAGFDTLTRSLSAASSRRRLFSTLLVALAPVSRGSMSDVLAKKGKGKAKGQKKPKPPKGGGKTKAPKGAGKVPKSTGGGKHQRGNAVPAPVVPATMPLAACTLTPEACDGCCQDGQCLPGTDHAHCGHTGMACQNCTAQAMICTATRDCGCDPTSCAGCCISGVCQSGDLAAACGRGGSVCHACPAGYVCRQGVCCGEEGAVTSPPPPDLPYVAACCEGLLPDPAGICRRGCAGLGCTEGTHCVACDEESGGLRDTCIEGRCCLADGVCPCPGDGPCDACCSGACAHGRCRQDCTRRGCPSGSVCCPSSGECFSQEQTTCRGGDGILFSCAAGSVCCQAPDGRARCGTTGVDGCATPFRQALPATCPEWVSRPATAPSEASSVLSRPWRWNGWWTLFRR